MKSMLAARYLGPERLEATEIPIPVIGDEEALLEVEACGFCGSDISIVAGTHPRAKPPLTLGH
jgi:(R,R)-butanediol dehydrogenase/meso-butanediol dehydrogenase/diacetyl reductase